MKFSPTLATIVAAGLVFLLSPYIPMAVLQLVGNPLSAAVMLLGVLYVLQRDVVVSLAVSLAVASLFLEYRRRIVKHIHTAVPTKRAPNLIPHELHPEHETPTIDEVSEKIEPDQDTVGSEREPLETVDPHSSTIGDLMKEHGFA
jgi:hypothetical protein